MKHRTLDRRDFLQATALGLGTAALGSDGNAFAQGSVAAEGRKPYDGPRVVIIRFGGGVRRQETIADPNNTYCPFFCHELTKRGTLFTNMEIAQFDDIQTSHGEGTLYILTGKYEKFKDFEGRFLGGRFESKVPTLFEYMRKSYDIPEHETLIINGEDRTQEEFYSFSNHHLFGASFRSETLSLYRFKVHLLRRQLEEGFYKDHEVEKKRNELKKLEAQDYRLKDIGSPSPIMNEFWDRWKDFYGDSGFVNPRGDRLLTELSVRALRELRPKLMMINYNDPDYVHWGNPSHYTRGITVIDEGIQRIMDVVDNDEEYRGNTIFAIVPDCGRDNNRAIPVSFQHHFNTKSSHEIFALFMGPGIAKGKVITDTVDQTSIAATLGGCMGMDTEHVEGPALEQVFV